MYKRWEIQIRHWNKIAEQYNKSFLLSFLVDFKRRSNANRTEIRAGNCLKTQFKAVDPQNLTFHAILLFAIHCNLCMLSFMSGSSSFMQTSSIKLFSFYLHKIIQSKPSSTNKTRSRKTSWLWLHNRIALFIGPGIKRICC